MAVQKAASPMLAWRSFGFKNDHVICLDGSLGHCSTHFFFFLKHMKGWAFSGIGASDKGQVLAPPSAALMGRAQSDPSPEEHHQGQSIVSNRVSSE